MTKGRKHHVYTFVDQDQSRGKEETPYEELYTQRKVGRNCLSDIVDRFLVPLWQLAVMTVVCRLIQQLETDDMRDVGVLLGEKIEGESSRFEVCFAAP